jgi:hypothetical protein
MVEFTNKVNTTLLEETVERLAKDIGLYPDRLMLFFEGIEDDYPDNIDFDPEFCVRSASEYAVFKLLSNYSPEQVLLIKKLVLLDISSGGDFPQTLNIINNFILQGYSFFQIMHYLIEGVCIMPKNAVMSEASMITNPKRPDPEDIARYLESRNT